MSNHNEIMASILMDSAGAVCATQHGDERLARLVERLIHVTGVGLADQITVAGRDTLSVFVGLCERRFLLASCRTAAPGPHVAENNADSLWIFNVAAEPQLVALVRSLGRDVRPGGTVAIDLSSLAGKPFPFRLRHVLAECGFIPGQQKGMMLGGDLFLVARKCVPLRAVAA